MSFSNILHCYKENCKVDLRNRNVLFSQCVVQRCIYLDRQIIEVSVLMPKICKLTVRLYIKS